MSQRHNSGKRNGGTNDSAGVLIFIHKFKGDILESMSSTDGRRIVLVIKQDNAIFIICNIYGFNSYASYKILLDLVTSKLKDLNNKYQGAFCILCGDFNECPDDVKDRYPPWPTQASPNSNPLSLLCSKLSLTDAWHFFNPSVEEFTWCNRSLTLKSRIDLYLIFSSSLQFVKEVHLQYTTLSDHKQIFKVRCNPRDL